MPGDRANSVYFLKKGRIKLSVLGLTEQEKKDLVEYLKSF